MIKDLIVLAVSLLGLAQAVTPSCTAGINRFEKGSSNTFDSFKRAYRAGAAWQDPEFPADWSSLYWQNYLGGRTKYSAPMRAQITKWMRPSQFNQRKPSLWGNFGKPMPYGTRQRALGDCWFLASMSAIAENAPRLSRVVWNNGYNKNGVFRFYFWVQSRWVPVNIDDRLPARKWGRGYTTWSTAVSAHNAWWGPLFEKAFAKLDQNYERITSGSGQEALRTLTAMPTMYFAKKQYANKYDFWKVLKQLASQDYPMTAGCYRTKGGLVPSHAYTILGTFEPTDVNGKVVAKLMKLRNPWSSERYFGPWSDKSKLWTQRYIQQANFTNKGKNDGVIFVPFEYFHYGFHGASVAFYKKWAGFEQVSVNPKRTGNYYYYYDMINPVAQQIFAMVETYSARHYPRTCDPKNQLTVFIRQGQKTISRGFGGWTGFGTAGTPLGTLPAGKYTILVINWKRQTLKTPHYVQLYSELNRATFKFNRIRRG